MLKHFLGQSKAPKHHRCLVIRDQRELWVLQAALTPAERDELAERERSPEARRRFAARLRAARRAENQADIKALTALCRGAQ